MALTDPLRRRSPSARIDIQKVRDPLAFIAEEHWRQRAMLKELESLARTNTPDRRIAGHVLAQLQTELSVHMLDEDEDLLPLLRRRAEPEDEVEIFIGRLGDDHAASAERLGDIVAALVAVSERGECFSADLRAKILDHVAEERRHLIFENAVVLPLARLRFTTSDKRTLALRMAARRGLCLLPGTAAGSWREAADA